MKKTDCARNIPKAEETGEGKFFVFSLSYVSKEQLGFTIGQLPLETGNSGNAVCRGPLTCGAEQSKGKARNVSEAGDTTAWQSGAFSIYLICATLNKLPLPTLQLRKPKATIE